MSKKESGSTVPLLRSANEIIEEEERGDNISTIVILDHFDADPSDGSASPYYRIIERKICCTRDGCIKGWKITAYSAGGALYLSVTCIVDGFDVQEFIEFLIRKEYEGFSLMFVGFGFSVLTQTPVFLTIIFNSERNHHHHSVLGEIREALVIGGPFAMVASAAIINFMRKFNANLPFGLKFISVPFAVVWGFLQYKFHGFFIHEAEQEFGNRPGAFFRAVFRTFFQQGWRNFFLKAAIIAGHAGEGVFDGRTFVEEWGIDGFSKTIGLVIKIAVPVLVILFHGLSESFAYDRIFNVENSRFMRLAYALVVANGLFHVIPGLTGVAEILLGGVHLIFGVDDWLAAVICMGTTVTVLGYHNVKGYVATTIEAFSEYFGNMLTRIGMLRPGQEAEDHVEMQSLANNPHRVDFNDPPLRDAGQRHGWSCGIQ